MSSKQTAVEILWDSYLRSFVGKRIQVARYPSLRDNISDTQIHIEDVVSFQNADEVFRRASTFLEGHDVFPFLGTLGGHLLCIGIGKLNRGIVSYLDFDFGLFELSPLNDFVSELVGDIA